MLIIVPVRPASDGSSPAPRPGRRQLLSAAGRGLVAGAGLSGRVALSGLAGLALLPGPVAAHHGYLGKHDFSRPLFIAGTVRSAYIGEPHGRLTVALDEPLRLPRNLEYLRAIEDAERRSTLSSLSPADLRGPVSVVLDAGSTRDLADQPERLRIGDRIEAIVYRRTADDAYRNELRAALLVLADGRVLVGSSPGVGAAASARG